MPEFELDGGKEIQTDQLASLARDILAGGRSVRFRVRGGSMRPFILDGDMLEIRFVKEGDVHLGDILLYHFHRKQLLVHRVIDIKKNVVQADGPWATCFVCQGDASLRADGCIAAEDVLGRVVSIEHAGHTRSLNTNFQRMKAVIIVMGLSGGKWIYRIIRKSKVL